MLAGLAVVLGLMGLAVAAALFLERRTGDFAARLSDDLLPLLVLVQSAILALGAWAGVGGRAGVLGFRPVRRRWLLAAAAAVAALLLYDAGLTALLDADPSGEDEMGMFAEYLGDAQPMQFLLLLAAGAGAAPLGEEMLFRGLLFAWLSRWTGWVPAALLTSLLFALGHLPGGTLYGIASFGAGLVLAALYRASGSLWPAVFAHALNNALSFALLWFGLD